jgi:hypothetical protein
MGQLSMRQKQLMDQKREAKHRRLQRILSYGGSAIGLFTKVNGMRSAAPGTQFKQILGVSSLALNALNAGTMLYQARKDSTSAAAVVGSAAQQQPTINTNFFLGDEALARMQYEQEQARYQIEYEVEEQEQAHFQPQPQYEIEEREEDEPARLQLEDEPARLQLEDEIHQQAEQTQSILASLSADDQRNLLNSMTSEERQLLRDIML